MGSEKKANYKATLNLPQTDFPMKASLPVREPEQLSRWSESKLYQIIRDSRKGSPRFILHDGPPYANGHIHMGHVLNKVLKDIVVKYKTAMGYDSHFVPGWDCHGLPIEHQLLKDENRDLDDIDQLSFRKEAHDFAIGWMDVQRKDFTRLGVFADWENPYLTLDHGYEAAILEGLRNIYQAGHMYKARKPVYWSVACQTALAEAEVEYENHSSPEVYVKFPLLEREGECLVIWTTTPWTLPANLACAVHPDYKYVLLDTGDEKYWVAEGMMTSFQEQVGLSGETGSSLAGKEMEGWRYEHPFLDRKGSVVLSEFVTLEAGTGLVHTAPGHGHEDYVVGCRYGLDVFSPVNEKGCFTIDAGVFPGENVFSANPKIVALLQEKAMLLKAGQVDHSYPHCWRSKTPIIFRATDQWFISMEAQDLRKGALSMIQEADWIPAQGKHRIEAMVSGRPDWCISRQRLWGVPIPALSCEKCQKTFMDVPLLDQLIARVKNEGVDIWFQESASELAGREVKCPDCGGTAIHKERDIVDVWFESGVSHQAVLEGRSDLAFPADLYLEGSDQHRGWFQSSLLSASALGTSCPFHEVLTHGFVVDADGRKMSKSQGNVVDPLEVMETYGADILRIWVAHSDYSVDLRLSQQHFQQLSEAYRKVRNTFRFLLGNLKGFEPEHLDVDSLEELDRYMILRFGELLQQVTEEMDQYRFYRAWHHLFHFCNVDLSATYLNIQKDVLYCYHAQDPVRISAQKTLFYLCDALAKLMAPFIPFTAEEAYQTLHSDPVACPTVFTAHWPEKVNVSDGEILTKDYQMLFAMREMVLKELEVLIGGKTIKSSNQATLKLTVASKQLAQELEKKQRSLKRFFIVAEISIHEADSKEALSEMEFRVDVQPKDGVKCSRCWVVYDPLNSKEQSEQLCADCVGVLTRLGAPLSSV